MSPPPEDHPPESGPDSPPRGRHLEDLQGGESAWCLPDALTQDADGILRLKKDAPCQPGHDEAYRIRCERHEEGFDVDRWHCRDTQPADGTAHGPDDSIPAFDVTTEPDTKDKV